MHDPDPVRRHLVAMEGYIAKTEDMLAALQSPAHDERDNVSGWFFDAYRDLASLHAAAATAILEKIRWEYESLPPLTIGTYRRTQDTPLPDPGGPLDGPEPASGRDAPPVAP